MLTCYFDFLTTPIITLFIGTITLILLSKQKDVNKNMKTLIKTCLFWAIGYGLMWVSKWTITDLIYNKNTWETAIYQILFRINSSQYTGADISIFDTLFYNIEWVMYPNIRYLGIGAIPSLILPFMFIMYKVIPNGKIVIKKENLINLLPFLLIAISPIVWFITLNNHSYYHCYFTYRNLIIFLIAINIFILNSMQVEEKKKGISNEKRKN